MDCPACHGEIPSGVTLREGWDLMNEMGSKVLVYLEFQHGARFIHQINTTTVYTVNIKGGG